MSVPDIQTKIVLPLRTNIDGEAEKLAIKPYLVEDRTESLIVKAPESGLSVNVYERLHSKRSNRWCAAERQMNTVRDIRSRDGILDLSVLHLLRLRTSSILLFPHFNRQEPTLTVEPCLLPHPAMLQLGS
ncbi:hypothetical protein ARMGADRAFT_222478 [Armillaria gallica]|uniref:Uncharacterized protein n=1 Tax=Armillaria gallica TaxID=47427 RepID=A0A2H3EDD3_ARMGA|nr:hypothetical protein ARMGADRAFT_222478 [Armillaria gallica]